MENRAYLLGAGILTGAAIALLTGQFAVWIPLGVVMGVALSLAARPRGKQSTSLKADS